ncbi:MAG: histidinol-phosphate aminotransferase family protein [Oscillospiraceae bacterium]|jgi:histidinol-phosphate aminotransferase|nr:histidinol-phosphate aminotransferase family protein [Oscillospiraceae bacterium]
MRWPDKLARLTPYAAAPAPDSGAVRLDANESFLTPPRWLWEKITTAVRSVALHRYPDPAASELCALFAGRMHVPASGVVAGNGSDELISLLMAALVPRGGRVLVSEPDFSMYRVYAQLYEHDCVAAPKTAGRPDMDALLTAHRARPADLIIFSNPCNPTGLGASAAEVLALAEAVDCPVVVDEAYMDFWDQSVLAHTRRRDNLIVLRTCSKALGLAGARLGFALSGDPLAAALRAAKSPFNVSALAQAVGAVVLAETEYLDVCVQEIRRSVEALYRALSVLAAHAEGIEVHETKTNFVLLTGARVPALYEALRVQNILVRHLPPDTLRVTAGTESEHKTLLTALEAHLPA